MGGGGFWWVGCRQSTHFLSVTYFWTYFWDEHLSGKLPVSALVVANSLISTPCVLLEAVAPRPAARPCSLLFWRVSNKKIRPKRHTCLNLSCKQVDYTASRSPSSALFPFFFAFWGRAPLLK